MMPVDVFLHDDDAGDSFGDLIALFGVSLFPAHSLCETGEAFMAGGSQPAGAVWDAADPLAVLTMEYREALLHPGHIASRHVCRKQDAVPVQAPLTWEQSPDDRTVLDELLGHRLCVDTILAEMDQSFADTLFEEEGCRDVLQVVAPASMYHKDLMAGRELDDTWSDTLCAPDTASQGEHHEE